MKKILFVCTGNTCRSPMAQGIFEMLLHQKGIDGVCAASAGLAAYTGAPASDNAVSAAAFLGADISAHRASRITEYLLGQSDLVVCMTNAHAAALKGYVPDEKLTVMRDEIPDPYGGDEEAYLHCAEKIKSALLEMLEQLTRKGENDMKKFERVSFYDIDITGGFWADRQKLNKDVTLDCVRNQFEKTGRFDAFKFEWKNGDPNRPHIFWDSDVAKWLESAAYILKKQRDEKLEEYVDKVVELIREHQCDDGYFNIVYTLIKPDERWQNRMEHELYCAGHLIEAAVAYFDATGKDIFLKCMCRYADYIEKVFRVEKSAEFSTPGHEEIELALVKLWKLTGEQRYLELSKYFIDARGAADSKEVLEGDNDAYVQDHLPVREQTTAEGHSVRACYLYSGMADIAREYGDKELFGACEKIFENIVKKRMYITGGIGSTRDGERFTGDYDLPNDTAYAETCAAISLAMFAGRMSLISPKGIYADTVERTLYNGIISGISLDGRSFFYENPLEVNLENRQIITKRQRHWPITQRVEVFSCSCCPPNMTRFVASVGDFIYSHDDDTLFIHQYMQSNASFTMGGKNVSVSQQTRYPEQGEVTLKISGMSGKSVAVRIPSWCGKYELSTPAEKEQDGYAYISVDSDDFELTFSPELIPRWFEASPHVWDDAGKFALTLGPVVYCLEGKDNGELLWSLYADIFDKVEIKRDDELNLLRLEAPGYKKHACDCSCASLYAPVRGDYRPTVLHFIPYYAFANRGESNMTVWVNKL